MWVTAINIIFKCIAADTLTTKTEVAYIIMSPNVLHVTPLHRFESKTGNGQFHVVNGTKHHVSTAHATTRHHNRLNKNIRAMRKNFGSKPWTYPQPVFIIAAYDEYGHPNVMNAAWGGIHTDDQIALCLSEEHKTTANILTTKAFTVSIADAAHVTECDYVGVVSGNSEPDKFSRAGFHATRSEFVNAPIIDELPMCLECELLSYDPETCHMTGRIVNVSADERILDSNGKIDVAKLRPITFDPVRHTYIALGAEVGHAFRDGLKLK